MYAFDKPPSDSDSNQKSEKRLLVDAWNSRDAEIAYFQKMVIFHRRDIPVKLDRNWDTDVHHNSCDDSFWSPDTLRDVPWDSVDWNKLSAKMTHNELIRAAELMWDRRNAVKKLNMPISDDATIDYIEGILAKHLPYFFEMDLRTRPNSYIVAATGGRRVVLGCIRTRRGRCRSIRRRAGKKQKKTAVRRSSRRSNKH
jgi:hypothetical protein